MRSLLFVPGNKDNMLSKATGFSPDVLVPDMEDSVPDAEKPAARDMIVSWLDRLRSHSARLMPRVNALHTDWFEDDVVAVVRPGVWGLSIGKVESADDIGHIAAAIDRAEQSAGLEPGRLRLIPWVESALAVVNCYPIASASRRIAALAYGGEDYAHDLGIDRRDDEANAIYARSAICNAARAAGVLALDTPYFQFRNDEGLRASCRAGRELGFKGRFAIHPAQIEAINACFSPSLEEIEQAERIVAAFEAAERQGRGSTSLDGRVIDVPVVKQARAVLRTAGIDY